MEGRHLPILIESKKEKNEFNEGKMKGNVHKLVKAVCSRER